MVNGTRVLKLIPWWQAEESHLEFLEQQLESAVDKRDNPRCAPPVDGLVFVI